MHLFNLNKIAFQHLVETEVAIRQLDDLKARHAELLALEDQIREIHSLFLEMSLLVEQQVTFSSIC